MIITAKFASVCPSCSGRIAPGGKVEWERGAKARHVDCSAASSSSSSVPSAPESGVRLVTVERVGRRSYLRGDTYAVRGMLRAGGCHWDRESQAWWIGSDETARELASKAATAPREAATARGGRNWDPTAFAGYGRPRGAYRKACVTDGNCSSFGSGRSCGGHECDGY